MLSHIWSKPSKTVKGVFRFPHTISGIVRLQMLFKIVFPQLFILSVHPMRLIGTLPFNIFGTSGRSLQHWGSKWEARDSTEPGLPGALNEMKPHSA